MAYPKVLARDAIAQFHHGRRVGNRLKISDVLSAYARRKKGFHVESLHRFDKESGEWLEAVVEDTHTPVFEQVAFRCYRLPKRSSTACHSLAKWSSCAQWSMYSVSISSPLTRSIDAISRRCFSEPPS